MAVVPIALVALFFLGMGLYGLALPDRLVAPFAITADSATSRTEVRAVYGGFGVATAIALILAAADVGGIRTGVCIAVAAALAGWHWVASSPPSSTTEPASTPSGSISPSN